jgi:poly-gamma-glutamate synthesis protein (capsule biosynthesis protein)
VDVRWAALAIALAGCGEPVAASPPTPPAVPVAPTEATPSAPPAATAEVEPPPDPIRRVSISAAGDLVLNALAMRAVRRHATEAEGYAVLLDGYARSLRDDEIAYVNLETPLVDDVVPLDPGWPASLSAQRPRHAPVLGASPPLARVLASIGVDVVSIANNHAYDQGYAGLRRTLAALDEAAIAHAGASPALGGSYVPLVIERGGVRVAWLSITSALNRRAPDDEALEVHVGRLDPFDRVERGLAAARAAADVVVVAVHWSTDFVMEPNGEQRAFGRRLVDAGADVVLGTGPHVLHPVVRVPSARGEALIAYSLGNVASGMGRAYRLGHPPREYVHPSTIVPEGRDGLVLRATIAIDGDRISIDSFEGVALWTDNDFLTRGDEAAIRTVPLAEAPMEVQDDRWPAVRRQVGSELALPGEPAQLTRSGTAP